MKERPHLIFFDLTRCLNPAILSLGCPTPQVCVEECPSKTMSGYALQSQGQEGLAKTVMKPFCAPMSESEFRSKSAKELINEGLCPAWTLPSKPILGRCIPTILEVGGDNSTEKTIVHGKSGGGSEGGSILTPDQTPNNQGLSEKTLKQAVTALGAFLSVRDFGERVYNDLSDTWWMIGLGFILACILSFLWIVLMRFLAGFMIWTSIFLVFILVSGLFGYSVYRYLLVKDVAESHDSIFQVNFTPNYLADVLALRDTWIAFMALLGIVLAIILLILIALRYFPFVFFMISRVFLFQNYFSDKESTLPYS